MSALRSKTLNIFPPSQREGGQGAGHKTVNAPQKQDTSALILHLPGVTRKPSYDTLKRMSTFIDPLEKLWDALLSREPQRIKQAFDSLDSASQKAVIVHLNKMATEDGWLDEQRSSAHIALDAIQAKPSPKHRHY